MSSWGNLDNVAITGTVTTATTANTVTGYSSPAFTTDVKDGDYIYFAANKYQVERVVSASVLYLTANAATNSDNVKAFVQQGPKYVSNVANGNMGNVSIQDIYGVDRVEINVPENKARGIAHTGWTHYTTYTDALSQTRHKAEVLVAMSKNFASNATGDLFGTGAGSDAVDDTVAADYLLYFTAQPANASNTINGSVSFVSAAASDPTGATLTYQWRENNTTHTYNLSNGGVYSGATSNTLAISNISGKSGYAYTVVVSGDGGADANTSDAATVTITS